MKLQKNKYFSSWTSRQFPNDGWIETKLTDQTIKHLKECIKKKSSESHNPHLAGHISHSYQIQDKDQLFTTSVLFPLLEQYFRDFGKHFIPTLLTRDCEFVLQKLWVNFQNKYEFNPPHTHTGIFSFVVWLTLPTESKKEHALKFASHSNKAQASDFQFTYLDCLGKVAHYNYELSPKDEGTMLFFPAKLMHQVFPFYTSNKTRISVSGNLSLDPTKLI